jgi:hypothetical protein
MHATVQAREAGQHNDAKYYDDDVFYVGYA